MISFRPIGTIRSPFFQPAGMPIQAVAAQDARGSIELFAEHASGLQDLQDFSHLILIYAFHRARPCELLVKPFLGDRRYGVFATRTPARPNPIGLSVVRLVEIDGLTVHISDIDVLDQTPLLDIKPYVPAFDVRQTDRIGWFADGLDKLPTTRSDDRFIK